MLLGTEQKNTTFSNYIKNKYYMCSYIIFIFLKKIMHINVFWLRLQKHQLIKKNKKEKNGKTKKEKVQKNCKNKKKTQNIN